MADHFLADALASVRRTLALVAEPTDDARLLARFAHNRDEMAFAELVARHGPAVWAACRRGTLNAADAEDAFQATFLVLARRADRVRRAASVGGWLFRVAVRLSARTRARAVRPIRTDQPIADSTADPADRAAWRDLVAVLDAELAELPDAVRAALVSCYYDGLTQDEAARRLGWKVRTVRARVARGRKLLRCRLTRRGVELGAALAAAAVGTELRAALPPVSLTPTAGATPPAVRDLVAHGVAVTGRSARLPLAVAATVVAVAGTGYVIAMASGAAGRDTGPPVAVASPSAAESQSPTHPKPDFDPVPVYNRSVDGCVYIVSQADGVVTEGTGALIDQENRLVVTTCRAVGDSDVVSIQFPYHNLDKTIDTDRMEYARSAAARLTPMGRVIRRDKARDLALVKLDRLGRHARALELAEPGNRGTVLHIGSGTGKLFPIIVRTVLAADAPAITLSGPTDDSGGPVVDRDGKLVGIVVGEATGPADRKVTLARDTAEIRAFLADTDHPIPPPDVPVHKDPRPPVIPVPRDSGPPPVLDPSAFFPSIGSTPKEMSPAEVYDKCVRSTVFIVAPVKGGMATGSGSLIHVEMRYILTTYHVVGDVERVYAQFPIRQKDGTMLTDKKAYIERIPAGQAFMGKVLFRDKTRDLAIIQLDRLPPDLRALPLSKKSVRVGEPVINIGNPGAVNRTFSMGRGEVRGVGIEDMVVQGDDETLRIKAKMVTVTNPINPGDSGGPLLDQRGYLVGVVENGSSGAATRSVNSCVDVTEVWAFLKEKRLIIKDLSDEKDEAAKPKTSLDSDRPKIGTPAKKENRTETPPKPDRPAGGGPSPEDEKAAAAMLSRAKLFADSDDKAYYAKKLQEVITKYPDTAAGKEAKKLLDALK